MALRYILLLLPAGSSTLSPILSGQFPFDTDSARANVSYTRNLIRIIDYAPELRADILALVTEKLVKIDVQIQVDMEEFEDEVGEDLLEDLKRPIDFSIDDEEGSDVDSVISDDDTTNVEFRRLKKCEGQYMQDRLYDRPTFRILFAGIQQWHRRRKEP